VDWSKSTSVIVVYALGILVIWKSKNLAIVAEKIATVYGKCRSAGSETSSPRPDSESVSCVFSSTMA